MNTKNKQKGFTLVELVIVIAVIAILAGVLIPTFSGVVEKANESKALQEAENALKIALIAQEDATLDENTEIYVKNSNKWYKFTYSDGKLTASTDNPSENEPNADSGKVVVNHGENDTAYVPKDGEANESANKPTLKDLSSSVKIMMSEKDAKEIK